MHRKNRLYFHRKYCLKQYHLYFPDQNCYRHYPKIELIMKRHAIYRHLSQKDIMPFPGSDPREFWQRAEERTQNTAKLYDQLGMAEYQAIEVFVKMF